MLMICFYSLRVVLSLLLSLLLSLPSLANELYVDHNYVDWPAICRRGAGPETDTHRRFWSPCCTQNWACEWCAVHEELKARPVQACSALQAQSAAPTAVILRCSSRLRCDAEAGGTKEEERGRKQLPN